MRTRRILALAGLLGVLWTPSANASGFSHVVVSFGGNYVPNQTADTPVVITEGDKLLLFNIDQNEQPSHDLTHCVPEHVGGVTRCTIGSLFGSATVRPGEIGEVFGVDELPAGEYLFYCVIHPTTMRGGLTVLPSAR